MNFLSIQPCGRRGSAHPRITSSNAVSTRISKRRTDRRSERLTCSPSSGMIAAGIGRPPPDRPEADRSAGLQAHREQTLAVGGEQRARAPDRRRRPRSRASPAIWRRSGSAQRLGGGSTGTPMHATEPASDLGLRADHGSVACVAGAVSLACRDAARPPIGFARARTGLLVLLVHRHRGAALAPLAHAQTTTPSATTRATCARRPTPLSGQYFAALDRVQALDDDIARSEQVVDDARARKASTRGDARARALHRVHVVGHAARRRSSTAHDTLDTARRAHLIDRVNAHDQDVYAEVARRRRARCTSSSASCAPRARRRPTRSTSCKAQGAAIDAKLAQAEAAGAGPGGGRRRAAAAATATDAADDDRGGPRPPPRPRHRPPPPRRRRRRRAPRRRRPTTRARPGRSPHHDDPFLSVRPRSGRAAATTAR